MLDKFFDSGGLTIVGVLAYYFYKYVYKNIKEKQKAEQDKKQQACAAPPPPVQQECRKIVKALPSVSAPPVVEIVSKKKPATARRHISKTTIARRFVKSADQLIIAEAILRLPTMSRLSLKNSGKKER